MGGFTEDFWLVGWFGFAFAFSLKILCFPFLGSKAKEKESMLTLTWRDAVTQGTSACLVLLRKWSGFLFIDRTVSGNFSQEAGCCIPMPCIVWRKGRGNQSFPLFGSKQSTSFSISEYLHIRVLSSIVTLKDVASDVEFPAWLGFCCLFPDFF